MTAGYNVDAIELNETDPAHGVEQPLPIVGLQAPVKALLDDGQRAGCVYWNHRGLRRRRRHSIHRSARPHLSSDCRYLRDTGSLHTLCGRD